RFLRSPTGRLPWRWKNYRVPSHGSAVASRSFSPAPSRSGRSSSSCLGKVRSPELRYPLIFATTEFNLCLDQTDSIEAIGNRTARVNPGSLFYRGWLDGHSELSSHLSHAGWRA